MGRHTPADTAPANSAGEAVRKAAVDSSVARMTPPLAPARADHRQVAAAGADRTEVVAERALGTMCPHRARKTASAAAPVAAATARQTRCLPPPKRAAEESAWAETAAGAHSLAAVADNLARAAPVAVAAASSSRTRFARMLLPSKAARAAGRTVAGAGAHSAVALVAPKAASASPAVRVAAVREVFVKAAVRGWPEEFSDRIPCGRRHRHSIQRSSGIAHNSSSNPGHVPAKCIPIAGATEKSRHNGLVLSTKK